MNGAAFSGEDRAFRYAMNIIRNGFAPIDEIHETLVFFLTLLNALRTNCTENPQSKQFTVKPKFMHFACKRRINRNFNRFSYTNTRKALEQKKKTETKR